jgi:hypothetical protein
MTTTYQKLLNKIEAFCNAHLQIKKYKGEFKEQMPNFATLDEKYPIVFVVPNGDTESLELNQFTLEVYCLDIIQKDRANINTIVSDCHLILKDLYLYFKDGTDLEVDVIGDPTMTPLNNDLLDYAAGWVMTITFEVEGYTVCAIPMNPIPPFTPICEDASYLVEYVNGTPIESGTIPSGGSAIIQVPDPLVCDDATVENSDLSYTATVASGGTLVLPDITVTDSDGSTFTQPAVTNVVCTFNPPCADATAELYFDGELIDSIQIASGDVGSFSIDCDTPLNAVRVSSDQFSHQHTGTFIYVSDINGKPSYEKVGDSDRIIYYDGTKWVLEKLGGGAHTHDAAVGNESFPWEANWTDAYLNVNQATIGTYCANGDYAYYRLVDTDGNVLFTGSIPSGSTADIAAPDTSIEVNGVAEGSVVAGSTVDVITNIVPSSSSLVGNNLTLTFTKELFWELNYNDTDDIIFIPATVNNVGTLTSGTGSNVGTIDVSTDGVTYVALTFPFTPVNGTTYYFQRSTATVTGSYTMTGTYA